MTVAGVSAPARAPGSGLSSAEAARRLLAEGPNEWARDEKRHGLRIFLSQFASPLVLVLIIAAVISRVLGERTEALVILAIVCLNACLGFAQEYRAEQAVRALRRLVTRTARVRRDGGIREVPVAELVRGDLVALDLGALVPADLQLAESDGLTVDESPLTGESVPVYKEAGATSYMGTPVMAGRGSGVVVATGRHTLIGRTASLVQHPEQTDFQRNIHRFSRFLLYLIIALTLFVFLVNTILGRGWFDSLLFALALAVGITPEVLPVIITMTLSSGALSMARQQVVVKRLISVEDLGNVDVLCCDKTGTLSQGEFALRQCLDPDGVSCPSVLLYGALAGSSGVGRPDPSPNPTDRAIWRHPDIGSPSAAPLGYRVLGQNPFDYTRRRASVLVEDPTDRRLVAKGAVESILPVCTRVRSSSSPALSLDAAGRERLLAAARKYEADGFRVLGVASKPTEARGICLSDECDLTFEGFLLFLDPPKAGATAALQQLAELGVGVKVMSGDSSEVTRRICAEVGLGLHDDRVINGSELEALTQSELRLVAGQYDAFARVTPEQKYQLVSALRADGRVVGFLGDGVNDAPALRLADVGISVDSATEVAKEAADIILLQKSLQVIADGIVTGRKTFANITKYILNTISANFGNMATVALSSLFLQFIPLLPSQILLNNLLSDGPLLTIAGDRVDPELLRRPRHWNIPAIARFMVAFGLLSVVFDLFLIATLLLVYHAAVPLFRTAWFIESACSEIVVTFAIRTHLPFYRSAPAAALMVSSILAAALAFGLPFTGLGQHYFEFVPVPGPVALLIGGVLAGYFLAAELAKWPFFRRFEA
jgi:Mg2+-importing ATPase